MTYTANISSDSQRSALRGFRGRLFAVSALAVLGGALVACGGGGEDDIVVETSTPTATSTPTPSPTPEPTQEPWPITSERIPDGDIAAPGLVNPTSINLPPPPQVIRNPEPNDWGVVRMFSPDLNMNHVIETLGVTNGAMDDPVDGNYAIGWYPPSDQYDFGVPENEGNLVFSAHETWDHMQGPFYQLHKAHVGDDIYLEMENGEIRHYEVARVTRYGLEELPMGEVLWPSDRPEAEQWLTLYTCGGDIIYDATGYGDYLARDVLVAKWVGMGGPEDTPTGSMNQQPGVAETAGESSPQGQPAAGAGGQ